MLWYYFLNFALLYPLFLALRLIALLFCFIVALRPRPSTLSRRPTATTHSRTQPQHAHNHRKPNWIRLEILRLKAHMPQAGCRCVARTFNRLHPDASVGKTFVAQLIAHHQHHIADLRRQIRSAQPRVVAVNHTWAMDLSFCTDEQQRTHAAVGILDHAPWQNGRIERLFGTLKPLLKQLAMPNGAALQVALDEFKVFYNHARPHQNLQGLTPAEHFAGLRPADLRQMPVKQVTEVQALAGLMRGYWIRR